jgi:hypothetical protein
MRRAPSPDDPNREAYLVLDDFGEQLGLAWRETDEADTELAKLIENLLAGQYTNPIRIVAFNTVEGWSRDVTKEIALEGALAAPNAARRRPHWRDSWIIMGDNPH